MINKNYIKNFCFNFAMYFFLFAIVIFFILLILGLFNQIKIDSLKFINISRIWFSIKLTLITATISSILATVFAIPIGYIISRHNFPMKNFIISLLYLPVIISPIALGAMLLIFFNTPIGTFFEKNFNIVFEFPAIILAQFVVIIGISTSLMTSVFEYINPEYENIARTLGATKFQIFFYNILPMAKKGIILSFLLSWARAVGEFGATVTLAGATTWKTETLPVAIFLAFASADIPTATVLILITLFIGITTIIILKMINKNSYDKNK